ncbi:S41 family peptidase [Paraclostridium sordellii]|uniref:S41 family peptidase n=3 Tax=Paraclostridium sordellii TaxID=1505 RepID=UPI0005E11D9C|nr:MULTISPECIES: S41 family peptidase [Paeniclostridium]MBW4861669.1 S41 family peptidase [Paeniclostridium sp.]CEN93406.1 peptidase [[Clostridium] sordellii] [Paeniclostridium sordellii]CEN95295.1 peptidase [[Clostridium] sordellii] [Paeniclostridium sordellii]
MKKIGFIIMTIIFIIFLIFTVIRVEGNKNIENKKWIEDITYLDESLKKEHPDLFRNISQSEWDMNIKNLKLNVRKLSDLEISLRIAQMISSIKDGHTYMDLINTINTFSEDSTKVEEVETFPIKVEYFEDGLRVTGCDKRYDQVLGYKLISINNISIDEVIKKLSSLINYDNEQSAKEKSKKFIGVYEALKFLDIVKTKEAKFLYENDSNENVMLNIETIKNKDIEFEYLEKPKFKKYMNEESPYWFEYIEEDNIFYFRFKQCLSTEEINYYSFEQKFIKVINDTKFEKLVIDLRDNRGGRLAIVDSIINELKYKTELEGKDIFAITNKGTASAAADIAWKLQYELGATIVGEETGGNVNFFGTENEFITLPNSKLKIFYPYNEVNNKKGYLGGVKPDIKVEQSYENYLKDIDDYYEFIKNIK